MIKTILHQIWNERRQNGWLFVELIAIAIFLWVAIDPLFVLYSNKYIDDEQSFLLVNFIYWTVSDGIQDNDIMEIVKFAYLVIFEDMRNAMFADLGDIEDPSLTAGQKLDILMTIYGEFKAANPEIVEANPELEVVEDLYEKLTDDTNGEALLSDDQLFAIVDTAVKALVVEEKPAKKPAAKKATAKKEEKAE